MTDGRGTSAGGFWRDADGTAALERFRTLVTVVDDGIFQMDPDGRFVAVNDRVVEVTGRPREELLGSHASLFLADDDWQRVEDASRRLRTADRQHETVDVTMLDADDEPVPCELRITVVADEDGGRGTVGVLRDRDERETGGSQPVRRAESGEGRDGDGHLSTLVDHVPGVVYRCRIERGWPMEFVSDACRDLTGYDPAALERDEVRWGEDVVADEDREGLWDEIQSTVTDREPFSVTYRIDTADGQRRWVRDQGRGILDDEGEPVEVEGVITDITERKRAKQRLTEERDMFAAGPAIVFRWQANEGEGWPVEYVSENVEDELGYAPSELESGAVSYADLLLDEDLDRIANEVEEHSDETTERFSHEPYRIRTKDGEIRWVNDTTKIVRDETGDITHYLGYLVDVTERKEREEELRRYETIVETANDGIYVKDDEGRFTMVNEAYAEMTGYDRENLIGEHASLVVDEETIQESRGMLHASAGGDNSALEADLETADGDAVPAEGTFATIRTAEGREEEVGVVRDITERKEYQRKLEESNERLKQFAYAASHDLEEPLRMVSSYLQLIERRYADELDEDGREFIEFAVDGADRMREMIDGLLQYSRVDTRGDPLEPVDLDAVLADVRDDLQVKIERSDAEIHVESLPTADGDEGQLRQLFQNLLDNAIEYSGDEPPRIDVSVERDGTRWLFAVTDEGIGIDPAAADDVFEVFHRLHTQEEHAGTGIGLPLCQRIVERHGGDIWVESTPGEGSTFYVTIPATVDGSPA